MIVLTSVIFPVVSIGCGLAVLYCLISFVADIQKGNN